jgi:hypothetical protein
MANNLNDSIDEIFVLNNLCTQLISKSPNIENINNISNQSYGQWLRHHTKIKLFIDSKYKLVLTNDSLATILIALFLKSVANKLKSDSYEILNALLNNKIKNYSFYANEKDILDSLLVELKNQKVEAINNKDEIESVNLDTQTPLSQQLLRLHQDTDEEQEQVIMISLGVAIINERKVFEDDLVSKEQYDYKLKNLFFA